MCKILFHIIKYFSGCLVVYCVNMSEKLLFSQNDFVLRNVNASWTSISVDCPTVICICRFAQRAWHCYFFCKLWNCSMLPTIISIVSMAFSFVLSGLYCVLESWEICINFYLIVRVVCLWAVCFVLGFLPSFSSAVALRCFSAFSNWKSNVILLI